MVGTAETCANVAVLLKGGEKMNKIREIRKRHGMTLQELATKVGVSVPYLSDIERGNRKGSKKTISLIADALEVQADELVKAG